MVTKALVVDEDLEAIQIEDGRLKVDAEITVDSVPICENLTILPFATYSDSNVSETQTNERAVGAYILFDITGIPGAGQTVTLFVDILQLDGTFTAIYQSAALATIGLRKYLIYPGAVDDNSQLTGVTRLSLPRTWRIRLNHSAPGNFTYGIGGYYLA